MLAVTADAVLVRHLLSVTAAVGVAADVEADPSSLRPRWRREGVVLVGVDQAARVADLGLPRRSEVYVLGQATDRDETHSWSARLGAAVVTLPEGAGDLAAVLAELASRRPRAGRILCVVGGSGGVGASTLAAALAVTAARTGERTLLVDGDPTGGGLDLLLGAEHLPGWRWPRLAAARGHLGDLGGELPHAEGVELLSMDRSPGTLGPLHPEQVAAVLGSAARCHGLTVVDLPRAVDAGGAEALRRADQTLLLVQGDVRGVAAARRVALLVSPTCRSLAVVVRMGRTRGLEATTVAQALELPLLATVEHDPSLARGAERGDPPGRSARTPLSRSCRRLLGHEDTEGRAA